MMIVWIILAQMESALTLRMITNVIVIPDLQEKIVNFLVHMTSHFIEKKMEPAIGKINYAETIKFRFHFLHFKSISLAQAKFSHYLFKRVICN